MIHRYVLHNSQIVEAARGGILSPGQVGLLSGWGVFSTIRIFDGVLFAFPRHWARMKRDAELLHIAMPASAEAMETSLLELVAANQAYNSTLRVAVVRNRGGAWEGPGFEDDSDVIALTADLKEWRQGVRLTVTPHARYTASRFTGAKILSWAQNLVNLEDAQRRGFDETLLLNERGEVSECTSANVFAAQGGRVWTPPLSSGCLPGVTREILLEQVHAAGVTVVERDLRLEDLERADEVFITSTTRELVSVAEIDGLKFRREGNARLELQKSFSAYVDAYVHRPEARRAPLVPAA